MSLHHAPAREEDGSSSVDVAFAGGKRVCRLHVVCAHTHATPISQHVSRCMAARHRKLCHYDGQVIIAHEALHNTNMTQKVFHHDTSAKLEACCHATRSTTKIHAALAPCCTTQHGTPHAYPRFRLVGITCTVQKRSNVPRSTAPRVAVGVYTCGLLNPMPASVSIIATNASSFAAKDVRSWSHLGRANDASAVLACRPQGMLGQYINPCS